MNSQRKAWVAFLIVFALGGVTGEDVAEVAGRNGEDDVGFALFRNPEPGMEIVDHLCQHPCPVDGVDRPQGEFFLKREIVEEGLDDGADWWPGQRPTHVRRRN